MAAVAGARIDLRLQVGTVVEPKAAIPYRVGGELYASRISNQDRRLVCRLEGNYSITPTVRQTEFTLSGYVSDEQLRGIEAIRGGATHLCFGLELDADGVDGPLPGSRFHHGGLTFPITAGEWCSELERVDAGAYVEILVPLPGPDLYVEAVLCLREARQLLRDGKLDSALVAARKALDPVVADARTADLALNARKKSARDRDLPERFAVLVDDLHSVLSGAAHVDEVTEDFRYTRAEATGLVAAAAGLLHRLAQQP